MASPSAGSECNLHASAGGDGAAIALTARGGPAADHDVVSAGLGVASISRRRATFVMLLREVLMRQPYLTRVGSLEGPSS
jgi:hypothetical protein